MKLTDVDIDNMSNYYIKVVVWCVVAGITMSVLVALVAS